MFVMVLFLFSNDTGRSVMDEPVINDSSFVLSDGEAWLTGWDYRKQITITGQTGAGTNYQIMFDVEYGSGSDTGNTVYLSSNSKTDFGDVRFTDNDGDTELDYWLEEYTGSGDATFWVEVADDLGSNQVIYIYYGKAQEDTTSNGDNTFIDMADFEENDITDVNKTANTPSSTSVQAYTGTYGILHDNYPASSHSGWDFGNDWDLGDGTQGFMGWFYDDGTSSSNEMWNFRLMSNAFGTEVGIGLWMGQSTTHYIYQDQGGYATTGIARSNGWHKVEYYLNGGSGGNIEGYLDGSLIIDETEADYGTIRYVIFSSYINPNSIADDYIIKKRITTEPAPSSYGGEEEPNEVPVNDQAPTCYELDDTDNLYAKYKDYSIVVYVSDADGYDDIDYLDLYLYSNAHGTNYWIIRYDEDTNTFSEQTDTSDYITLNTGTSSAVRTGNDIDATFEVEINWNHPETLDIDLRVRVFDASAGEDDDYFENNWEMETRLDIYDYGGGNLGPDDGVGTVDRGTIGGTFIYEATYRYYQSASDAFPDDSEIDIWVSSTVSGGPWSALTWSGGAGDVFNIDADSTYGIDTYNYKIVIEGAGSGGADLMVSSKSDTYISDLIKIVTSSPTSNYIPKDTGTTTVNVTAALSYDDEALGAGDSLTLNGTVMTWDTDHFYAVVGPFGTVDSFLFLISAGDETTRGVTLIENNGQSSVVYTDQVNVSVAANLDWTVVGYNITLSYSGIWVSNGTPWTGQTAVLNSSGGTLYPAYSTTGIVAFGVVSVTGPISSFVSNPVLITWDNATVSSNAYYWVQYSLSSVWLVWQSGTWTWEIDGRTIDYDLATDVVIQSHMNGTSDDWAIVDDTGDIGDLIIGEFDTTWYYVTLILNVELVLNGQTYDFAVWTKTLTVDILHSIHIEDSGMDIQDAWITFVVHTNWDNASITIWDNGTEVGFFAYEGWYQIAKPSVVGLHNYTMLINGSHFGSDSTFQYNDTTNTNDSWKFLILKYTVNPIELSFAQTIILQNNVSVMVTSRVYTAASSLDYTVYENGVYLDAGTISVSGSGSWITMIWDKSSITTTSNFSIVISDGTYNVTIVGYNIIVAGDTYMTNNASSFVEGDEIDNSVHYLEDPDAQIQEAAIDAMGEIILVLVAFVIGGGMAVVLSGKWRGRKTSDDHHQDRYRWPT